MVSAIGVDGECADDFAGGGVDDAHVVAVDEQDDGGSVEGSSEADVVEVAVDAQADPAWDPRVLLTLETRMEYGNHEWCAAEAAEVSGRAA